MTMTDPVAAAEAVLNAESVKQHYVAKLEAAYQDKQSAPQPAITEPQFWWDLISIGPIQTITNPPYAPGDVIRSGERAYVVTIVLLNTDPILPLGMSPADLLSNFALPFEVTYQTGNLTGWTPGPANVNTEHNLKLVPGQWFYVDVLEFVPREVDEVMFEMNVSARIFGCGENYAPAFSGFAREVIDVDSSIFAQGPRLVSAPIRYEVYGPKPANEK
jgi:hypothetical protein